MSETELARSIIERYGTHDVRAITSSAGLSIKTGDWHPVTAGEFIASRGEIIVNGRSDIAAERVIAHELGHFFLAAYGLEVSDVEGFCDRFADALLPSF